LTTFLLIVAGILVVGIIALIVLFLAKKNAMNAALGSLIALLSSLIASMSTPQVDGSVDMALHFGSWGSITAKWAKINTTRPIEFWYMSFATIGLLTFVTLYFVGKKYLQEQ